jgi:hypothetical protein
MPVYTTNSVGGGALGAGLMMKKRRLTVRVTVVRHRIDTSNWLGIAHPQIAGILAL